MERNQEEKEEEKSATGIKILWRKVIFVLRFLPKAKQAFEDFGGILFKGHHKVCVTNHFNDNWEKSSDD